MKKFMVILFVFVFCFTFVSASNVKADASLSDAVSVILNGRVISFDVNPQMIGGRCFVPMRKIFEEMGATVSFDNKKKGITIKKDDKTINMSVGSTYGFINELNKDNSITGSNFFLSECPIVVDSRMLIPARAISDCLGATVEWNDVLHKVIIFDWDNITNIISYPYCISIPDFGQYTGLDYTTNSASYEVSNCDRYDYLYDNALGENKEAILSDYKKVLEKNGFVIDSDIYNIFNNEKTYYKIEKKYGYKHKYSITLPNNLNCKSFDIKFSYTFLS